MLPFVLAAQLLAPAEMESHFIVLPSASFQWSEAASEQWLAEPASARLRAGPMSEVIALAAIETIDPPPPLAEASTALQRGDLRAAAAAFERLAATSHGPTALAARFNALAILIGLGERAQELWALEPLAVARGPATRSAAALFWTAGALLPDEKARVVHARVYLRGFAGKGGRDLQARAELIAGRDLWRRACPVPEVDGTCGVMASVDWYHGCGRNERELLIVLERDPTLAAAAQRHFAAALRHAEARESLDPARAEARRDVASEARWLLAEPHFETFLRRLRPLEEPTFIADYLADFGTLGRLELAEQRDEYPRSVASSRDRIVQTQALLHRYEAVITDRSPRTLAVSLLRSAQVVHNAAIQLARQRGPDPPGYFCCQSSGDALLADAEHYLAACERLARATDNIDVWAERCIARRRDPAPELHAARTRPAPVSFPVQLNE